MSTAPVVLPVYAASTGVLSSFGRKFIFGLLKGMADHLAGSF